MALRRTDESQCGPGPPTAPYGPTASHSGYVHDVTMGAHTDSGLNGVLGASSNQTESPSLTSKFSVKTDPSGAVPIHGTGGGVVAIEVLDSEELGPNVSSFLHCSEWAQRYPLQPARLLDRSMSTSGAASTCSDLSGRSNPGSNPGNSTRSYSSGYSSRSDASSTSRHRCLPQLICGSVADSPEHVTMVTRLNRCVSLRSDSDRLLVNMKQTHHRSSSNPDRPSDTQSSDPGLKRHRAAASVRCKTGGGLHGQLRVSHTTDCVYDHCDGANDGENWQQASESQMSESCHTTASLNDLPSHPDGATSERCGKAQGARPKQPDKLGLMDLFGVQLEVRVNI